MGPGTPAGKAAANSVPDGVFLADPRAWAAAIEGFEAEALKAFLDAYAGLFETRDTGWEAVGPGVAGFAEVGSPVNRAVGLGFEEAVTPDQVEAVEAFFRSRNAKARVDVCPYAESSLLTALRGRGYEVAGAKHVFVLPLGDPGGRGPRDEHRAGDGDVVIVPVSGVSGDAWATTVARGFSGEERGEPDRLALANRAASGTRVYVAEIGGEAVGGGALRLTGEIAGLFSASTRVPFRRRGVQTALLAARLADARRAGAKLATVQAMPGADSERNIRRAGFTLAYTKITVERQRIVKKGSRP